MRALFAILFFMQLTVVLHAQNNQYTISGTTIDDKGTAIPFSTAVLFRSKDSSQVTGAVADEKGKFAIKVVPGKYFLKISLLSFQDKYINNINLVNKDLNTGNITLKAGSKTLSQVEIIGEKKLMELELDKRVYNVSQDVSNIGANASEVLSNVPSVTVDVDGNVALRGSQGVRILIDGKPSALTGIKSTDALRNLQGAMIDRIEVVTNPSSRFDAAGETGVINIILKKNKTTGFNGNFTGTTGYPANYGAAYSINYRNEKMNLFSSFGLNYRKSPGKGTSERRFTGKDTSYNYNETTKRERKDQGANIMVGMDYYLNTLTTLTGSFMYSGGKERNTTNLQYDDFDENGTLSSSTLRINDEKATESNTEATLSFRKKFADNDKREWTADAKWTSSGDVEKSNYNTQMLLSSARQLQRSDNPTWERNLLLQTDYIHPFGKDARFETGLKATIRMVSNDFLVEEADDSGSWTALPQFDNNMEFTEKIYAGYAMFGSKVQKFSYQLGLRGEISDIRTGLIKTNEVNKRNYFNLFPSTSFSYQLNNLNTLQLSYSYRINRPNYRDLTPFSDFSDPRVYFVGNPNLNPEYTHSMEAGHLLEWSGGSILSGVYYRHKTGVVERISVLDSITGINNIRPVNLATRNDIGVEVNLALTLATWWKFNTSANLYRAVSDGVFEEKTYHSEATTITNRTTSRMTFFKSLDFQASLNYQAPRVNTQGKDLAQYSIDLGLAQDVFKGKGTLTFNVRDLMNSRRRRSITDIEGYYAKSNFQWRARQLTLTLNYRLNQQKIEKKEREEGMGEN